MKATLQNAIRLYTNKRYTVALRELHSLDDEPGKVPEIAYYLGLCYTQLQQYDEALIYLEQVVTTDSDLIHMYQSRMILSYIYAITGRYRLARFELDSLIESGYESAQVYAAYGFVAYETKNYEEAIDNLQKAIEINPENANALNSYGYILCELDQNLQLALKLCKRAVQLDDTNPAYLDSLGWAYNKIGDYDEAISYLRKALSTAGGDKEIAEHVRIAMAARSKKNVK